MPMQPSRHVEVAPVMHEPEELQASASFFVVPVQV